MPKIAPIPWSRLAKIFELDGWRFSRMRGDHCIYVKPGYMRPVVIPRDPLIAVFIIQNNMRTARMPRERYFELLTRA